MTRFPLFAFLIFIALCASAQSDTLVTRLLEVRVVGVKQCIDTDLSAVTQISAQEVQRLGIVTMRDASAIVPNFYMPAYGSRMTSSIYVRGLGARIDQPVVGLNIDNVPILNKDNYDFDLLDIEHIDVFRGAQSILNGRNTMAGQVNISTINPWRYQGVRLLAEMGNGHSWKAGAAVYHKFSDAVASSLSAHYTSSDGFFRNRHTGEKLDTERQGNIRWKLALRPSSRFSVMNVASVSVSRQGGYPYRSLQTSMIAHDDTCFYRRNAFTEGLTLAWTGKRVLVTSVTSYQYIDDNLTLDQDFTPQPYFTLTQRRHEHVVTQDLYAKGSRSHFDWVGGVFGFLKNMDMAAPVTFKEDGVSNLIEKHPNDLNPNYPIRWDDRAFVLGSDFDLSTKGLAVYGQTSYQPGPWNLELGLRLDIERADLDYNSQCHTSYTTFHKLEDGTLDPYSHTPVDIALIGGLSNTFVQLIPKIAAGYSFCSDANVYLNVAKGYKSGGFNTQMFSDVLQQKLMSQLGLTEKYDIDEIVSYKPEKSWNLELGADYRIPDRRFSLQGTLFFILCTDQQLTTFPDGLTTGRIMTNAGRTRSLGAELSAVFSPLSCLTLRASYGYTNAKFLKYNDGKQDYKGNFLPYAPINTLFGSAAYTLPCKVLGCTPSLTLSARGIGRIYWDDSNEHYQPFYATMDASAALERSHVSIRIWAENLTSTHFDTFYFVSMGNAFVQQANPCVFGATLRYVL